MTSLLTIPFRIFLTVTGVIAAVGLCVRVYLCMWDIAAEKTGELPVSTRCVCAHSTKTMDDSSPIFAAAQAVSYRITLQTCETPGWRLRVCVYVILCVGTSRTECRCDGGNSHPIYFPPSLTDFSTFVGSFQHVWSAKSLTTEVHLGTLSQITFNFFMPGANVFFKFLLSTISVLGNQAMVIDYFPPSYI